VNNSTGEDCVLVAVPEAVLSKLPPGKFLDFSVNVACGVLRFVDPVNVRSGITLLIYVNLSPSPMSMTPDSMKEFIEEPSSSYPNS
tara:strand:- start:69 stop:326 length:258 start_codon:yes stop_codon:yes gene_type:complete